MNDEAAKVTKRLAVQAVYDRAVELAEYLDSLRDDCIALDLNDEVVSALRDSATSAWDASIAIEDSHRTTVLSAGS